MMNLFYIGGDIVSLGYSFGKHYLEIETKGADSSIEVYIPEKLFTKITNSMGEDQICESAGAVKGHIESDGSGKVYLMADSLTILKKGE